MLVFFFFLVSFFSLRASQPDEVLDGVFCIIIEAKRFWEEAGGC